MINQVKQGVNQYNQFALCPSTVKSGDAVLLGTLAAVAMVDYDATTGGAIFCTDGEFTLTVIGQSAESPVTNAAIKPGAKIYATGTLDSTTNVTTSLTLDSNTGNSLFGTLVGPSVGSGLTVTNAVVRLKIGAA